MRKRLLVVDLEATCHGLRDVPDGFEQEIIEIGAVLLNTETLETETEYHTFVRPEYFPVWSAFCRSLTSISQSNVDSGMNFPEAFKELTKLYERSGAVFASCSEYDPKMLELECLRKNCKYPFHAYIAWNFIT